MHRWSREGTTNAIASRLRTGTCIAKSKEELQLIAQGVIEADTKRVNRTRIRPASNKLCKAGCCVVNTVEALERKGIQHLIKRRRGTRAKSGIRHRNHCGGLWS